MKRAPRFEPGEIVTAEAAAANLGPVTGKVRPVVLVEQRAGRWTAMPVTTMAVGPRSTPRVPVPGWENLGLHRPSYLDDRLEVVPVGDVRSHVGWASNELVDAVAEATHRSPWELEDLRPHARQDRRRRARAS